MKGNFSRETLARHLQRLTGISRQDIFGGSEEAYRPLNLPADAATMFAGYVGCSYRPGQGLLILAINPGGGGDSYTRRIPEDEELYPLLAAFKGADADGCLEAFEQVNKCFARIVQSWNIWRILQPTLTAAGRNIDEVAYMNVIPYRTRGDKIPPIAARRQSWACIVAPTIEILAPETIIALGKKVGSVIEALNTTRVQYFCVPRTIGDTYVCEDALRVLSRIRKLLPADGA